MTAELSRTEILELARTIASAQPGGALATVHDQDATPYVAFVVAYLRENGEVLFGSSPTARHARNLAATREASMLIDNRGVIGEDWTKFTRVVIEGHAGPADRNSPEAASLMAELTDGAPLAAFFAERGEIYRIAPRRLVLMRGLGNERHFIDFDTNDSR